VEKRGKGGILYAYMRFRHPAKWHKVRTCYQPVDRPEAVKASLPSKAKPAKRKPLDVKGELTEEIIAEVEKRKGK